LELTHDVVWLKSRVEKVGLRMVKKFGVGSTDTFDEVLKGRESREGPGL
jgi:hypothetical protein